MADQHEPDVILLSFDADQTRKSPLI